MSDLKSIYLDHDELSLSLLTEEEKLQELSAKVSAKGFKPEDLVYCGIEGEPIRVNGILPEMTTTFGLAFNDFKQTAQDLDSGYSVNDTPFEYAFQASKYPAILAYDSALLRNCCEPTSHFEHSDQWEAKDGSTLTKAARLIIYFAEND
jgi:hypothetical protein